MKFLCLLALLCVTRHTFATTPDVYVLTRDDLGGIFTAALARFKSFAFADGNRMDSVLEIQKTIMILPYSVNKNTKTFSTQISDKFVVPESIISDVENTFREVARTIFPKALPGMLLPLENGRRSAYLTWPPPFDMKFYRFELSFRVVKDVPSATPFSLLLRALLTQEQ